MWDCAAHHCVECVSSVGDDLLIVGCGESCVSHSKADAGAPAVIVWARSLVRTGSKNGWAIASFAVNRSFSM